MLRLASDADVHGEILCGLCRSLPEIDLVTLKTLCPKARPTLKFWLGPHSP